MGSITSLQDLEEIRARIRECRSRRVSPGELERLAQDLGRHAEGGKKEPQWKSGLFTLPRISIPKKHNPVHAGIKNNILNDFESQDIPKWEAKLGLVERTDDDTYTYRGVSRAIAKTPIRKDRDP